MGEGRHGKKSSNMVIRYEDEIGVHDGRTDKSVRDKTMTGAIQENVSTTNERNEITAIERKNRTE